MTTPTQAQVEAAANGIPRATAYAEQIIENSGRFSDEVVNLAEQYLHFRDAAAAQVGETFNKERYDALPQYDPETIERCAQVAEQHWIPGPPSSIGEDIAAAIRKLKDE